jgi:hypothetical protein
VVLDGRTGKERQMKEDFAEKIVDAVLQMQKGSPIKDFLSDSEIEEALSMLADVLVITGVKLPED